MAVRPLNFPPSSILGNTPCPRHLPEAERSLDTLF